MPKTCVVCKKEESVMMVSVADESSGAFSSPVPVCEDCFHRLSKVRVVKIVESSNPAYLKGTVLSPHKTTVTSVAPAPQTALNQRAYRQNIRSIITWLDWLRGVNIAVAIISLIVAIVLFQNKGPIYGGIAVGVTVSSALWTVVCHLLYLAVDAVDEYLEKHDK
jgi:hypothetical protein